MLLSYQYSLLYITTLSYSDSLMSAFIILQRFKTDKMPENIFIKELLYNAISVSRFTISKEQSINAPLLSLATVRKSKKTRVKYIFSSLKMKKFTC